MIKPYYQNDYITLYHGDCLEVIPFITKDIDLLLTDPPYGINKSKGVSAYRKSKPERRRYTDTWDKERIDKKYIDLLLNYKLIMFGGNYYTDILPQNNHWIVWDKVQYMPSFSGCELAYTNLKGNTVKKYTVQQAGFIGREPKRYHPTQKPVKLITLILQDYSKENNLILDPFAGSGTTLIASYKLKRRSIGIEIDKKYCDIIIERIKEVEHELTSELFEITNG